MLAVYDPDAPKQELNLSINGDLLTKAAELRLNLAVVVEKAIAEAITHHHCECWLDAKGNVLDAAIGLLGNKERAVRWLTTPARALGFKRPIDSEVSDVLDLIVRIENGFCA